MTSLNFLQQDYGIEEMSCSVVPSKAIESQTKLRADIEVINEKSF